MGTMNPRPAVREPRGRQHWRRWANS